MRVLTQSPSGDPIGGFIVQTASDLPAPVGGLIDLPSGDWTFAAPFTMNATIIVGPTFQGSISGNTAARITNNAALFLDVQLGSKLQVRSLHTLCPNGDCFHVANDFATECTLNLCDFQAAGDCLRVDSGAVRVIGFRSEMFNRGVVSRNGAEVQILGARLLGGNFAADMDGGNLQIIGGQYSNLNVAVHVSSPGDTLQLVGTRMQAMSTGVEGIAGVTSATLTDCRFVNMGSGIKWAAAALPTDGLAVVACGIDNTGIPFDGFTYLSARANSKACLINGALASETPIVP